MSARALVANAADRGQQDHARKVERERALQEEKDFRELMEDPRFRRFMWGLLTETKVFNTVFALNATIYYNAGRQDLGHMYQGKAVRLTPVLYLTMIQENSNEET